MNYKDINWREAWKEQWHEHQKYKKNSDGHWNTIEAARTFYRMAQENNADRIRKILADFPVTPESRILDIGSGPGAVALPLATQAAHVTAVEPSECMVAVLHENMEKMGVTNITTVQKRWEDIDPATDISGPYDIVFASFSLDVPDIGAAIDKMRAVSSHHVFIYWFAGETSWDAASIELWPQLHGTEYVPSPGSDIIFSLLYNEGIYANIECYPFRHVYRFDSLEKAVDNFRSSFFIETEEQETILRDYLLPQLQKDGETWILPGDSIRVKIWWEKETNNGKNSE